MDLTATIVCFFLHSVYLVFCFEVNVEPGIDKLFKIPVAKDNYNDLASVQYKGGMVSVDCMRCLCLRQTDCQPQPCVMFQRRIHCGYFMISREFWNDCNITGIDWKVCASDFACASQCVQNYMSYFAKKNDCLLQCEGFSRELYGGPKGCNDPQTRQYWESVQRIPGCKGVV